MIEISLLVGVLVLGMILRLLLREDQIRQVFVDEDRVRAVLQKLAVEFHQACQREVELQQQLLSERQNPALELKLGVARARVHRTKKAFWRAVKLVSPGYLLPERPASYTEFLPK